LGRQLALLRRAAGYNQYRLADSLPYSRSTVANVEIGRQDVSLDFWQRCDELLGSDGALVRGHEEIQLLVRCDAENGARQMALRRQLEFSTQDDLSSTLAPIARVALHDIRRDKHGDHASQLFAAMHAVRNGLERSLVDSSVTTGQLDDLEETVVAHAHDCVHLPPIDMLCRLTLDTADVRDLLAQPQPPQTGLRLRRISASLAVLMADELMVLGDVYAARSW
jgi:transcriptional regulator with XRE-family HTH domain